MNRPRKYKKHFDSSHSILYNAYPETYTSSIGVPGEFVEKINRNVNLKDGTQGEMDSAYIADPDDKILKTRAAVCLEHQSIPVNDGKMDMISYYDIQLVTDENLPTLLVVASKTDPKKSVNKLIRTPSDSISLYFLDLSEKNICQRLNNLKEKINNNKKLSIEDKLNLGIILLYAPQKDVKRITETIVDLYLTIHDDLDIKMEKCLYSVIRILTDAYIDDEKTYKRLTKMMDKNTSEETKQKFEPFDGFIESIKYRDEKIAEQDKSLAEQGKSLAEKDERLAEQGKSLAEKDERLAEQEKTIALLKREIYVLKNPIAK
ncbi:MAG: hypothetical protein IJ122_09265 [Methanobrevibacter sp.]|nr:hypothetical protein [Methanobrevibacter sp.]